MQEAVNVFRRTGAPCFACSTPIQRIKLAQRSTHFCKKCQPGKLVNVKPIKAAGKKRSRSKKEDDEEVDDDEYDDDDEDYQ